HTRARKPHSKTHASRGRPPFDCIALLLQGGGALGAYQAGVYQGLAEADLHPDWVAGISIGAINSALIAGNRPEERVEMLRGFWRAITVNPIGALAAGGRPAADAFGLWGPQGAWFAPQGDLARGWANRLNAAIAAAMGAPGMFAPRLVNPWLQAAGSVDATSY